VRLTLQRVAAAGLGWPLPAEITDAAPPGRAGLGEDPPRAEAKHVTLSLLGEEYIEEQPQGHGYSRFCEL
jgi:hypothetical protein